MRFLLLAFLGSSVLLLSGYCASKKCEENPIMPTQTQTQTQTPIPAHNIDTESIQEYSDMHHTQHIYRYRERDGSITQVHYIKNLLRGDDRDEYETYCLENAKIIKKYIRLLNIAFDELSVPNAKFCDTNPSNAYITPFYRHICDYVDESMSSQIIDAAKFDATSVKLYKRAYKLDIHAPSLLNMITLNFYRTSWYDIAFPLEESGHTICTNHTKLIVTNNMSQLVYAIQVVPAFNTHWYDYLPDF